MLASLTKTQAMSTKEEALRIFEAHYTEWENSEERNKSGYDYERTYLAMMQRVQREVLQSGVGEVSRNKNLKKKS